jgi:hypothetical protein
VVPVELGRLQPQRVQAHLLAHGAQGNHAEGLRLTAGEQGRAVRAWRHPGLDLDGADLVRAPTVGALLVHRDALADDRLLQLVERHLRRVAACLVLLAGLVGVLGPVLLEHLALDGPARLLAVQLVLHLGGLVQRRAVG